MKSELDFRIAMMHAKASNRVLTNTTENYWKVMENVSDYYNSFNKFSDEPTVVTTLKSIIGNVMSGSLSKAEAFEALMFSVELHGEVETEERKRAEA